MATKLTLTSVVGLIEITEKAAKQVKILLSNKEVPKGYALRIGARGAGCSGIKHFLAFDKPKEHDSSFETQGIKIIFDKRQALYLAGYIIDYQEDTSESGFFFEKAGQESSP